MRVVELKKFTIHDITEHNGIFIIDVPDTKTGNPRKFVVDQKLSRFIQDYMKLRPKNTTTDRFFVRYHMGTCSN